MSKYREELSLLNRIAVHISPSENYMEWARNVEETTDDSLIFDPRDQPTTYLISGNLASKEQVRKALAKHWKKIASDQFSSWHILSKNWPKLRTISDFELYFHWNFSEMVYDLSNKPLEVDEF